MIFIEKTEIFGWEAAIRGMRNSFNSWDRSDSKFDENGNYIVGEADLDLMDKLSRSGPSHAKFLRYINVSFDITAPRYWWAEMDKLHMAGTKAGGQKAAATNKTKYGKDFYAEIGRKGGHNGFFFSVNVDSDVFDS